jgi:NAD(P)-dependent dehydrogenase (short-subunit alcohol dehydrogenase family)
VTQGVAVVTGGASGFGWAIADQCAARGFDVAVLDIDGDRAAAQATALTAGRSIRALGLRVDVGVGVEVEDVAATVQQELGGVDLVFSNVGVQQIGALERFSDEAWAWMLDINVVGSARVARAFLPDLRRSAQRSAQGSSGRSSGRSSRRSSRSHLVFTASSSVLVPATHLAAYQATKFAVLGLAETLRLELAGDGIAVSVLFPSGMATRHLESSLLARPASVGGEIAPAEEIEAMLASNPGFSADVATPEEAARHVLDDVLAGQPYIITHGDLVAGLAERQEAMAAAARRAQQRWSGS